MTDEAEDTARARARKHDDANTDAAAALDAALALVARTDAAAALDAALALVARADAAAALSLARARAKAKGAP